MKPLINLCLWLAGAFCSPSPFYAQTPPAVIRPESKPWFSPPNNPLVQGAWLIGAENQAGPYLLRVRLQAEGQIPPHTHPDERITTVLQGTLYVGFGQQFEAENMMVVPAGAVYIAPANTSHYVWAKEGEVIYQEAGTGPTATHFLE